ncbi:KTSC domain-containing protein [Armatimonas sp.]|uniref:KTSC domain-containing protein n=1 Tax=Armatimonas sp. TaxID=1872638 RepID=UPI00374DB447
MTLVTVDSSMLDAVGYDEEAQELEAVFASGKVYRYEGVPKEVYEELLASDSKGSFMHSAVIDCYPDYPVRTRRRRY